MISVCRYNASRGSRATQCIAECHMYDYLPIKQKLWVSAQCKEFLLLRNQVHSHKAKVPDLVKPTRKPERLVHGSFRDKTEACQQLF